jgi:4-amino-4-deoxy-L-arabinose transferase-like glycosyltransferase
VSPGAPGPGRAGAGRVGWALALLTLAFHLALAGRYGFFRDELYFLACGQHLAWGYVDQPPLIALAARLSQALFGTWLPGIRLLPALAAAALVLLSARMASHLGGGPWARALAGLAAALGPQLLFVGHTLTMNAFEPILWTGMAFAVLRIAEGGSPRLWLLAGALAGLAMLNKHSALFWIAALVGALILVPERRILRSRWFAAGAGLAALVVLPHAIWQVANGFPILELLRNGQLRKNAPIGLAGFLAFQPLGLGPGLPVALAGLVALLAGRLAPRARFLGIAFLLAAGLLVALRGKGYYLGPAYPPLLAGGGAALEAWLAGPARRAAAAALVLGAGLALAPLTAPLLPPESLVRYSRALHLEVPVNERLAAGALPQHVADQFGWEEKAAAVERAWRGLPAAERDRARIYAGNYGRAAAVDVLGGPRGLPPAASCHNNYWIWSRRGPFPDVWIALGGRAEDYARSFEEVELLERIAHDPWVMPYEDRLGVFVLRRPRVDLSAFFEGCRDLI